MKKYACIFAAFLSIVSVASTTFAADLPDIKEHWAMKSIMTAVSSGYVDGYPDGNFKPDQNISRAEFIKLAVTALKYNTNSIPGQQWYEPFVQAAVFNGMHMYEDYTSGDMNTPIKREEMARLAVRSAGEKNTDPLKWMYLAASKGIINGLDDQGMIGADQPTTRAQAITVIERMLKLKAGEKLPSDKYATSAAEVDWHKTNVYTMAPEYFGWGAANGSSLDFDKLRYDDGNGNYSETEKYIVVDMEDLTDPNRKLIPDNMRWMRKSNSGTELIQEVPSNVYAFLSFDHFRVELTKRSSIMYSYLQVIGSFGAPMNNVDNEGIVIDNAIYAEEYSQPGYIQWGHTTLDPGVHEKRLITGQLVPKMRGKNKDGFSIYRSPAQWLGEKGTAIVFHSIIDHSLGGK